MKCPDFVHLIGGGDRSDALDYVRGVCKKGSSDIVGLELQSVRTRTMNSTRREANVQASTIRDGVTVSLRLAVRVLNWVAGQSRTA